MGVVGYCCLALQEQWLFPIRETVSEPVSVRKITDTIVAASTPDFSTDPTETSPFVRYARRNKFDRTNLT